MANTLTKRQRNHMVQLLHSYAAAPCVCAPQPPVAVHSWASHAQASSLRHSQKPLPRNSRRSNAVPFQLLHQAGSEP